MIKHYVASDLERHKLCLYLLNDIIRYWRTICVDFEWKTATGDKPRAIRLIKLRFARMMLYVGGVAAISKTVDMPAENKQRELVEMFALPPITRLQKVFGKQKTQEVLMAYATFLKALNDKAVRDALDGDGATGIETDEYRELANVARDFRDGLESLLVGSPGLHNRVASALLL